MLDLYASTFVGRFRAWIPRASRALNGLRITYDERGKCALPNAAVSPRRNIPTPAIAVPVCRGGAGGWLCGAGAQPSMHDTAPTKETAVRRIASTSAGSPALLPPGTPSAL